MESFDDSDLLETEIQLRSTPDGTRLRQNVGRRGRQELRLGDASFGELQVRVASARAMTFRIKAAWGPPGSLCTVDTDQGQACEIDEDCAYNDSCLDGGCFRSETVLCE